MNSSENNAAAAAASVSQSYILYFTVNAQPAITSNHTITIPPNANTLPAFTWTWAGDKPGTLTLSTLTPTATISTSSSTSQASPTSSPTTEPARSSNCTAAGGSGVVATGSAVGLAFGCLLAGALLSLSLGLFWFRRRKAFAQLSLLRGQPLSRNKSGREAVPLAPPASNSPAHVLEKLPEPITRADLDKEASQWNTNIRNYLDNHADLVTDLSVARGETYVAFEQLSILSGHKAPWYRLLRDKTSRYNTLRMLIARIVANRVSPETAVETSLLPQNILRAYQGLIGGEKQSPNSLPMQNIWRTITMNLFSTTHQTSTAASLATSPEFASVQETAKAIQSALGPLLVRRSESGAGGEAQSLVDVVAKGTLLGLRMFEQSNPTRFFWKPGDGDDDLRDGSSAESPIVFPGIKQRRMQPGSRDPTHELIIVPPVRAGNVPIVTAAQ